MFGYEPTVYQVAVSPSPFISTKKGCSSNP
jgi:hypothetical protein